MSSEVDEILSSVQDLVRRAYAQGRADALKQVVQVMQADEAAGRKPLALTAPESAAAPAPAAPASGRPARVSAGAMKDASRPWWERIH